MIHQCCLLFQLLPKNHLHLRSYVGKDSLGFNAVGPNPEARLLWSNGYTPAGFAILASEFLLVGNRLWAIQYLSDLKSMRQKR